ncbi:hypothetical protein M413DRAFT_449328 [Hebeloma cylindrosporum]|uniref:Uncharacterized protein n=1 Tax=Hebeloma cylindrosporum TaxID=76867 RepID=A0A0C3BW30_HEBCY|nr:hypothetical protein M413DRAFT_449328 [Hebeloma cylindrosporum h7]
MGAHYIEGPKHQRIAVPVEGIIAIGNTLEIPLSAPPPFTSIAEIVGNQTQG